MIQLLFALVAGVLTVGAPCILPVLPIILGSSIGQKNKLRPLFITLGFVLTFAIFGLLFSIFANVLGISQNNLRIISVVLLAVFGIFLIWPRPFELLTAKLNKYVNRANTIGTRSGTGIWGGFVLGAMLGVIWTPCAGPVLGSILTLVASKKDLGQSALLLSAYALGAAIPMLVIAYGGQYITSKVRSITKYTKILQQVFGVVILALAVGIHFNYDTLITAKLTQYFPTFAQNFGSKELSTSSNIVSSSEGYKTDLGNFGEAPEFTGIDKWLNGNPQTIADLKGKVVLIDFWTYSCINCIRTLPYVTKWYDTYKDQGLVVIGVHTPEFAFEKDSNNVLATIKRFNIHYPVAQDNEYATWNAYNNQFWPAEYLIDQNGNIVSEHFGEGNYDISENNIRKLLGLNTPGNTANPNPDLSHVQSPEMYFKPDRIANLTPGQSPSFSPQTYALPNNLTLNTFGLQGTWNFDDQGANLLSGPGKIELHFSSSKVYIVASADKPVTVKVYVSGLYIQDVTISGSQLYTLFDSQQYKDQTIEIQIPFGGFHAFTFTFG